MLVRVQACKSVMLVRVCSACKSAMLVRVQACKSVVLVRV